jgi:hypothetical protein
MSHHASFLILISPYSVPGMKLCSLICYVLGRLFFLYVLFHHQGGRQSSNSELTMIRSTPPRDVGKSPVSQGSVSPGMPFNEQQLRQLRAQCLVFLAFR